MNFETDNDCFEIPTSLTLLKSVSYFFFKLFVLGSCNAKRLQCCWKKLRWMTTIRSVHVSSLLLRFFLGEQSLANWSLLTTLTWHWHGDILNNKFSLNPLFEVFVYAKAAPLQSTVLVPFLLFREKKLCQKPLLTSYDFLFLVVFSQML